MPAVIGGIRLVSVGTGGQFQAGDAVAILPKTAAKTYTGSGNFNTGDAGRTMNLFNATNTNDQDALDSNISTLL